MHFRPRLQDWNLGRRSGSMLPVLVAIVVVVPSAVITVVIIATMLFGLSRR